MAATAMIAVLLAGCSAGAAQPAARRSGPAPGGMGRFVLTLNGPERSAIDLMVELNEVRLRARGGGWFQIPVASTTVNSVAVLRRQIPLADVRIPAGRYDKLTLQFGTALLRQEGKVPNLSVPPDGFTLDVTVDIEPDSVAPLFITWDVERAVEREAFLAPAFTFRRRRPMR